MDKTHVINKIFGIARKLSYVELVDEQPTDPIQFEVPDSMKIGALFSLKEDIRDDDRLGEDVLNELVVDVSLVEEAELDEEGEVINDGTVRFTFPNLTRHDYNGDRYELDRGSVEIAPEAIEEEMLN